MHRVLGSKALGGSEGEAGGERVRERVRLRDSDYRAAWSERKYGRTQRQRKGEAKRKCSNCRDDD